MKIKDRFIYFFAVSMAILAGCFESFIPIGIAIFLATYFPNYVNNSSGLLYIMVFFGFTFIPAILRLFKKFSEKRANQCTRDFENLFKTSEERLNKIHDTANYNTAFMQELYERTRYHIDYRASVTEKKINELQEALNKKEKPYDE